MSMAISDWFRRRPREVQVTVGGGRPLPVHVTIPLGQPIPVKLPVSLPLVLTEIRDAIRRIASHLEGEQTAQVKLDEVSKQLDQVQSELARFQPTAGA